MTASDTSDFGATLRAARERRGISLRQIADSTKISMATLEALERNDISRLPGGIFTRAFVRSYAHEVGLDPEATVRDFLAQFPVDSAIAGHPASNRPDARARFDEASRSGAVLKLIAFSSATLAIALYFGIGKRPLDAPIQPPARPSAVPAAVPASATSNVVARNASIPATDRPSAAALTPSPTVTTGTLAADGQLSVGLSATARCWVSVTIAGKRTFQRELQPGESESFSARDPVVLVLGNAGGLMMTVNGLAARPLGKSGQVVTIRLTTDNYKTYLPNQ